MNIIKSHKAIGEEFHFPSHCALIALATVIERDEMRDISIPDGCMRIVNHAKSYDRLESYVFEGDTLMGVAMFSVMNDPHYGRVCAHTVFNTLNTNNKRSVRLLYRAGLEYAKEQGVKWIARSKRLSSTSYLSIYKPIGD
ncbi:MAG: hypothetical protein ACRDCE_01465 [Cetobacterium sp.]|uniref:hypothetical protein n=1 Tax=Cetobacterium sp. TaxID=2071632 RepID=UPI003EE62159